MSKQKEELMSLPGAAFTGIGSSIGVALVAYIGFVIAAAGKASFFSILIGLAIGLSSGMPMYFLTKRMVIHGAQGGLIEAGLGKASAAFFAYGCVLATGSMSTYPLSIASYIVSAFPAMMPFQQGIGFLVLVLAVLTLCFGVKIFENVSKVFGFLLLVGLVLFTTLGLVRMVQTGANPLDFSMDPIYAANGINGVLAGVPLFAGTCTGFVNIGYMGSIVSEPKKNVPKAILISCFTMSFFWIFLTLVAANVLPVEQVAGQPLTYVAKELMPEWLAVLFVITGPTMAILTTYIPGMQMNAAAIGLTASRGLLPKCLAPKNPSAGIDRRMVILIGIATGVILMFNLPVNVIVANLAPCTSFSYMILLSASHVAISFRRSDLFDNSRDLKVYRVVSLLAAAASILLFYLAVRAVTLTSALINIAVIIAAYRFAIYKSKKDDQTASKAAN